MGRLSDLLFSVLEVVLSPIARHKQRRLDAWVKADRGRRAAEPLPGREPPRPAWDPADAAAPDWTLRMNTISLPPGPHTRPKVVIVDLWLDGRGRYAAGDPAGVGDPDTELPNSVGHALLKMVDQSFPAGFSDFGSFQNGRMELLDGTPATLTIFRRQPYACVEAHTNLGLIGEFQGGSPAPPVLDVCELLWRLHQAEYRPG